MIETERLRIYVASQAVMEQFIELETDDELKKAWQEMLDGSLSHPAEEWKWRAMWIIELKDGTHIGDLSFKGVNADGTTEIGYGILKERQGCGYATEAVRAVVAWAEAQNEIAAVEAETEPDNLASQRVLAKCGFIPSGTVGEEGPRFVRRR